jgi:hypothetical protein
MLKMYLNPITVAKEFIIKKRVKQAAIFIIIQAVIVGMIPGTMEISNEIFTETMTHIHYSVMYYIVSAIIPLALTSIIMAVMFPLALKLIAKIRRVDFSFAEMFCVSGVCNYLMIPWTIAACIPVFFVTYYSEDLHSMQISFAITALLFLFGLIFSLFSSTIALKETSKASSDITVAIMSFATMLMIVLYLIIFLLFYNDRTFDEWYFIHIVLDLIGY